jgi:hypothetical protein
MRADFVWNNQQQNSPFNQKQDQKFNEQQLPMAG